MICWRGALAAQPPAVDHASGSRRPCRSRRRRRWQQPVDRPDPDGAGLFDVQPVVLAHATPALEIGDAPRARSAYAAASASSKPYNSGWYMISSRFKIASRTRLMRILSSAEFPLVGVERAPQRQPVLAGLGARLDLAADARRPVGVGVADHRLRRARARRHGRSRRCAATTGRGNARTPSARSSRRARQSAFEVGILGLSRSSAR